MHDSWSKLDVIMQRFSPMLRDELNLTPPVSNCLASTIASEVLAMPSEVLKEIREGDAVGLARRIEELTAFERFMDYASKINTSRNFPPLTRAQVAYQIYTVFVYLGEACFLRLRKAAPPGTALKKCCKYLTDHPIRGFRNAIAHANWHYSPNFTGLTFFYYEDEQKTKLCQYAVSQLQLDFWDKLARVTAYASFQTINDA